MSNFVLLRIPFLVLLLQILIAQSAFAGDWSLDTHRPATGDFNGDGIADLVLQSRNTEYLSAVVLGLGNGHFDVAQQRWDADYLGLNWLANDATIYVGDFNGDGRSDLLVQRKAATSHSILLAASNGRFDSVSFSISNSSLGLDWSGGSSQLVIADFNGDGRDDVLLQPRNHSSSVAIVTANASGNLNQLHQSWSSDAFGLDWTTSYHNVIAGDWDGNGKADLFLQSKLITIMVPGSGSAFMPVSFLGDPNHALLFNTGTISSVFRTWQNGYMGFDWDDTAYRFHAGRFANADGEQLLAQAKGEGVHRILRFYPGAVDPDNQTGAFVATEEWSDAERQSFSANTHAVLTGDIDGDGYTDLLISSSVTGSTSYIAYGTGGVGTLGSTLAVDWAQNAASGGYAAGAVSGELSVTPTGAASYVIPISVPPGVSGMQPELSINYSSQGGNGLLGMGWSLGGLSVIHRCPASLEPDGFNDGVDFDSNDRFCLDGQKLIAVSGVYGANGTEYRTEIDSFSKIVSYGTVGGGPVKFRVWTKSGLQMDYAYSADSRIEAQGKSSVLYWALNKVSDAAGNYMTVAYTEDAANSQYRPASIDYTGNAGAGLIPHASVTFDYEARGDVVYGYPDGSRTAVTQRLSRISTSIAGSVVREYRLAYDETENPAKSRLIEVMDCAPGGPCLPPTKVTWNNIGTSMATFVSSTICAAGSTGNGQCNDADNFNTIRTADINGDGYMDLCYRADYGVRCVPGSASGFNVAATVSTNICSNVDLGSTTGSCNDGDNHQTIQFVDMNADGMSDLVFRSDSGIQIRLSTGTGFGSPITTGICANGSTGYGQCNDSDNFYTIQFPDINGDGYADVCYRADYGITCIPGNGNGFNTAQVISTSYCKWGTSNYGICNDADNFSTIQYIDMNADGMSDIVYRGDSGIQVILSTGTGFTTRYSSSICANGSTAYTQCNDADNFSTIQYPDYNGDGYPDVCFRGDNGITCIPGTGKGFNTSQAMTTGICAWGDVNNGGCDNADNHDTTFYRDVNADGMSDLIFRADAGIQIMYSNGSAFVNRVNTGVCKTGQTAYGGCGGWFNFTGDSAFIDFPDVNGDGLPDLVYRGDAGISTWTSSGSGIRSVASITDGFGNVNAITYKPLTDNTVYIKKASAVYPMMDYRGAMYVVSRVDANDGIGGTRHVDYAYLGARLHLRGRGFLGFFRTDSVDSTSGILSRTYYQDQNFPYTGIPTLAQTYQPDGTTLISQTLNTLAQKGPASHPFPYVESSVEKQWELDGSLTSIVTTTSIYNDYGDPTQIQVATTDGVDTFTSTTVNQYLPADTVNWWLGRLDRATVTSATPVGSASRTSAFEYSATTGMLTAEIVEPDAPQLMLRTAYGHDTYGNRSSVTVTDSGVAQYPIEARTSTTLYDYANLAVNGTYRVVSTNALGHSEEQIMDARFGVAISLTGPNGLTTSWDYDAFGRKVLENRADGTRSTWSYAWCDFTCLSTGAYLVRAETDGAPPVTEYYDRLGRKISVGSVGMNSRVIYQDTLYNAKGQVDRVSRNYFDGDAAYWTTFAYDLLGRPIQENSPDGGIVYKTYAGLTSAVRKTAVNGGFDQTVTRVNDVQGNLKQLIDQAGESTYYQYDPHGNLTQVTDIAGNVSAMSYDSRGRKTAMDDPDMGHWDYAYDALGQLRWQRDARQQIVTLDYDKLGRMTGRTEPEGAATWTYDTAVKGIGKLAEVHFVPAGTSTASYLQTRTYDSLGRPDTTSTSHSGQTLVTRATYDAYGREATFEYPGGFATRNIYNSLGFLTQLENAANAGELYWLAEEADADGRITLELLGNGLETVRMYNAANGTLQGISTGFGSGSAVQYLTYEFDALGNLKQRQDHNASLTEDFTYDVRNRLASATLVGIGTKTYQYDSIGNITAKDGHIDYAYGAGTAGPHAVTTARGNSYQYDANGNMTGGAGRTLQWTSYNKPHTITKGSVTAQFAYGPERDRYRQIETDGSVTRTTLYLGKAYEQITTSAGTEHKYYLGAGGRTIAVRTRKPDASIETRYLHTDHLGSTDVITDEYGTVTERLSFSAFGARRDATNWQDALGWLTSIATSRGFTGHEQLDKLGLIHMNGRVYDPELGRFLSADPVVQQPTAPQNLNRYSYVNNNPLSFTDPTGFIFKKLFKGVKKLFKNKIFRAIASIALGALTAGASFAGAWSFWGGVFTSNAAVATATLATAGAAGGFVSGLVASGGNLRAGVSGAITGAIFGSIHALGGLAGFAPGGFEKVALHGLGGGINSSLQGGQFKDGFIGAAFAQGFASKISGIGGKDLFGVTRRVVAAAVVGGTASVVGGGKFANGARSAAFGRLFNDDLDTLVSMAKKLRNQVYSIRYEETKTLDDYLAIYPPNPGEDRLSLITRYDSFDASLRRIGVVSLTAEIPGRGVQLTQEAIDKLVGYGLSKLSRLPDVYSRDIYSAAIPADASGVGIVCNSYNCDYTLNGDFDGLRRRLGGGALRLK